MHTNDVGVWIKQWMADSQSRILITCATYQKFARRVGLFWVRLDILLVREGFAKLNSRPVEPHYFVLSIDCSARYENDLTPRATRGDAFNPVDWSRLYY